jgi:hypothetical protein
MQDIQMIGSQEEEFISSKLFIVQMSGFALLKRITECDFGLLPALVNLRVDTALLVAQKISTQLALLC